MRGLQDLFQCFGIQPAAAQGAVARLLEAYASPNRHYHTLGHIQQVLQTVEQLRGHTQHREIVQLAAWFHDVVYDARATDNEEQSAAYARDLLTHLGVGECAIAATTRLILVTKHHQADDNDPDAYVLLDADLAILGSSPQQYQQYAQAIRREYNWVPEAQYRAGRRRVLEAFLQRGKIYYTHAMFERVEAAARQNLRREIESLL